MRILVTGATGVLGRATVPLLRAAGHDVAAPSRDELDLFDASAVAAAVARAAAVFHLATRIGRWAENDRLRAVASRLLVDGALAADTWTYVQPTVTFLGPPAPPHLESAVAAEAEAARFAAAGRRGVVLRLGYLDGPGTGNDQPVPIYGSTLHVDDAARALVAALDLPSGIYRVDRETTSSRPVPVS